MDNTNRRFGTRWIAPGLLQCAILIGAASVWVASASAWERPSYGPATKNASPRRLEAVQGEIDEAQKQHAAKLIVIRQGFADLGLNAEAKRCRELGAPLDASLFRVVRLPKNIQPEIPAGLPDKEHELRVSLHDLQEKYAADLYVLCRKVLTAGYPSYAFRILEEVVRQDPDHSKGRRILGYKLRNKEWVTPFANEQLDKGNVWDDTFGWLPKDHVSKYKAGKRYRNGRWMSADLEAELCREINHGWTVRTDHYLVRTNYSLERGVEIAKKLELFHDFFMQTFAAFFSTPDQMQKLFQSSASSSNLQSRLRPYRVDYFRTREEYCQKLIKKVPQIRITNGLYFTGDRVAYFYYDPQMPNQDTLFHEATHQLFYENEHRDRAVAMDANFWIIEGIACYMESYHSENGQSFVGDPKHPRIVAARHRVIVDNYYIPLERFSEMGMIAFQSSREISKNYSQAAGLARFFMLFEGGRYRDALTEHLSELYRAGPRQRQAVHSLAQLTGVPFIELDRQYEDYMRTLPGEIPQAAIRRTSGTR
jgi:hypothetical protein